MSHERGAPGEQDENKLITERRRKLGELRATGFRFPNDFRRSALAGQLHAVYDGYADGSLEDGPFKDVVTKLAQAFHDWVDMVQRSRQLLAEDAAHAEQQQRQQEPA